MVMSEDIMFCMDVKTFGLIWTVRSVMGVKVRLCLLFVFGFTSIFF